MTEYNIFRPLSNVEKNEIIELKGVGQRDLLNMFLKDLANKQQEYQKKYLPLDTYGARIDFDNMVKSRISEISSAIDPTKVDSKIDFGDFEEYGRPERFEYIGSEEVKNVRLVAGIKQDVVSGIRYTFKSKARGNRLSIAVPNEDVKKVQEYVEKTYLKTEVKDKK
jgi:hypothetical protein